MVYTEDSSRGTSANPRIVTSVTMSTINKRKVEWTLQKQMWSAAQKCSQHGKKKPTKFIAKKLK